MNERDSSSLMEFDLTEKENTRPDEHAGSDRVKFHNSHWVAPMIWDSRQCVGGSSRNDLDLAPATASSARPSSTSTSSDIVSYS